MGVCGCGVVLLGAIRDSSCTRILEDSCFFVASKFVSVGNSLLSRVIYVVQSSVLFARLKVCQSRD